jgi:hypothetical protein
VALGAILLVAGGFLLGGSWSIYKADTRDGRRTVPQVVFAVVLLLAALLATAAGVLRLI